MVEEYRSQLYEPAHRAWEAMAATVSRPPHQHTVWNSQVNRLWPQVRFLEASAGTDATVLPARPCPCGRASIWRAWPPPTFAWRPWSAGWAPQGELEEAQVLTLDRLEQQGTVFMFGRDFAPLTTGRLGFSVRVTPNHYADPLNRPCNAPLKWMA